MLETKVAFLKGMLTQSICHYKDGLKCHEQGGRVTEDNYMKQIPTGPETHFS